MLINPLTASGEMGCQFRQGTCALARDGGQVRYLNGDWGMSRVLIDFEVGVEILDQLFTLTFHDCIEERDWLLNVGHHVFQ